MIRMTHAGLQVDAPAAALDALRREFDERHCILLKGFVSPALLQTIQRLLAAAPFYDRTHDGIGEELCLSPGPLSAGMEFLWNSPALFDLVDRLTGCGPFGCFEGRVYRLAPSSGHYDSWHSDVGQDRRVAMSVNFSTAPYEGGVTEFRRAAESEPYYSVANTGFGDAILFRVDPALRHRVTDVTGQTPRTAYAGWFRTTPDFADLFRARHPGF
ncbi:MAG TPA: 2OG-Fe(II) oxygenase [Vicinamibacterales bacterium]